MLAQAIGSAVALAAAGLLMSGLATAGSEGHGPGHGGGHTVAADGSMVHDGVTFYAGPVPDVIPDDVLAAAEPTAIAIPAIGVGSELLDLGLQPDGSAEVPADYALAGWFREGGRPGVIGPTVVLGHVDSPDGPAVFYRLRDLVPGDVVEVRTAGGAVAVYSVDRIEQVSKDEFPTFEVFGATRDDVLRLVTCAGEFDRGERSYEDNLVVHASRSA
ncbi:sortase [Pseudonocardia sp.]|uniref:sortase domain-containing protein n=1 Tax=Pseudonocardia sp. TaxID=60912 RepID=UPI00260BF501|nr:sortase [Pseudonocardia sp.]